MSAPTPVSAYLHSATMVKAGIYLLARTHPFLSGTPQWQTALMAAGAITAVYGAVQSLHQADLKRMLAYTTVMALGTLTMLLSSQAPSATAAAMTFLLVHALYKSALFMVVGSIDHECGTRQIGQLSGLKFRMPMTTLGAAAAAMSMAGFPLFFGFVGKEIMYKGALVMELGPVLPTIAAVAANAMMTAAAGIFMLGPFWGKPSATPKPAKEAPPSMWMGPVVLGGITVVFGIIPWWVAHWLVQPAVRAFYGNAVYVKLALYHGVNVPLILSILTLSAGAALYIFRRAVYRQLSRLDIRPLFIFDNLYDAHIRAIQAVAETQTRILQNGSLHRYMAVTVVTATLGIGTALFRFSPPIALPQGIALAAREWAVVLMIVMGVLTVTFSRSRLTSVCALGVSGAGIALLFMMFGAPDLALTQLLVETLTVIIVSVILLRLPVLGDTRRGFLGIRWADAVISVAAGLMFAWLILGTSQLPFDRFITDFYETHSYQSAHGRNIVNVILVDFRGLDTMGEITVVALAGLAAFTLIRSTPQKAHTPFIQSLILHTATRMLVGLILIFSVYLLFRGHHEPGGGFAGALVAATGFSLFAISEGPGAVRSAIRVEPQQVIFAGLLIAISAGLTAVIVGKPFMTGLWGDIPIGPETHFLLSTPLVFDIGVYITVIGAVLTLVLALEEDIA